MFCCNWCNQGYQSYVQCRDPQYSLTHLTHKEPIQVFNCVDQALLCHINYIILYDYHNHASESQVLLVCKFAIHICTYLLQFSRNWVLFVSVVIWQFISCWVIRQRCTDTNTYTNNLLDAGGHLDITIMDVDNPIPPGSGSCVACGDMIIIVANDTFSILDYYALG